MSKNNRNNGVVVDSGLVDVPSATVAEPVNKPEVIDEVAALKAQVAALLAAQAAPAPVREEVRYVTARLTTNTGEEVDDVTCYAKDFKTGSKGFWGGGKVWIGSKRYQMQCQLVEIHSK